MRARSCRTRSTSRGAAALRRVRHLRRDDGLLHGVELLPVFLGFVKVRDGAVGLGLRFEKVGDGGNTSGAGRARLAPDSHRRAVSSSCPPPPPSTSSMSSPLRRTPARGDRFARFLASVAFGVGVRVHVAEDLRREFQRLAHAGFQLRGFDVLRGYLGVRIDRARVDLRPVLEQLTRRALRFGGVAAGKHVLGDVCSGGRERE